MAETMAHHLLPVSVAKKQPSARPFPGLRLACEWALLTALSFAVFGSRHSPTGYSYAITDFFHAHCNPLYSVFLRCVDPELTEDDAETIALWNGIMRYAAPQALAAALALLLPCRRRWIRRALAYIAFAAGIVSHCMYCGAFLHFAATNPGYRPLLVQITCSAAIFMFAVGDLAGFLALLLENED